MPEAARDDRRKPPRRTAERILAVTLDLFNRRGEPNVSTTLISAELNMSPGNLYYHFPAKEALVNALMGRYETALNVLLGDAAVPPATEPWLDTGTDTLPDPLAATSTEISRTTAGTALDAVTATAALPASLPAPTTDAVAPTGWALLPALLRLAWHYRFLFRDLNDLLARNRQIETRCQDALARQHVALRRLIDGLRGADGQPLSPALADVLATHLLLVLTYWLCQEFVRDPRHALEPANEATLLARGSAHLQVLLQPYLSPQELAALASPAV
jgi:AcrR family transcriptional regulator